MAHASTAAACVAATGDERPVNHPSGWFPTADHHYLRQQVQANHNTVSIRRLLFEKCVDTGWYRPCFGGIRRLGGAVLHRHSTSRQGDSRTQAACRESRCTPASCACQRGTGSCRSPGKRPCIMCIAAQGCRVAPECHGRRHRDFLLACRCVRHRCQGLGKTNWLHGQQPPRHE